MARFPSGHKISELIRRSTRYSLTNRETSRSRSCKSKTGIGRKPYKGAAGRFTSLSPRAVSVRIVHCCGKQPTITPADSLLMNSLTAGHWFRNVSIMLMRSLRPCLFTRCCNYRPSWLSYGQDGAQSRSPGRRREQTTQRRLAGCHNCCLLKGIYFFVSVRIFYNGSWENNVLFIPFINYICLTRISTPPNKITCAWRRFQKISSKQKPHFSS